MSNSKSYNQILFITTLSVYLGLVLVGASPQVLAQAALTSRIEQKEQIENVDDLENKPDEDSAKFADAFSGYLKEVEYFILDLQKLHRIDKFDPTYNSLGLDVKIFAPCKVVGNTKQTKEIEKRFSNDNWVVPAIADFRHTAEKYEFLSDCVPYNDFENFESRNTQLILSYDKADLKISISFENDSPSRAQQTASSFLKSIKSIKRYDDEVIIYTLYESTTVTSADNQVIISTRLPRGSIDSLLNAEK